VKKVFLGLASIITLILFLGQFFSYSNGLIDLVTDQIPSNCFLSYPTLYTIFAPFFLIADQITLLSLKQHISFIVFLNMGWFLIRFYLRWGEPFNLKLVLKEGGKLLLFEVLLSLIYAWAILVPRPMAALVAKDADTLVIDFHSHTQNSWDARKSFSIEKNLLWHAGAGFHATFITDHNVFPDLVPPTFKGVQALRGEEVSLYQSHWVLLGLDGVLSNTLYDGGTEGIEKFLKDMKKLGRVVFTSLPEYWFYHWGVELESFIDWGADGFEIANSAPQALDFPMEFRRAIIELCRKRNLTVVGISDNHGWGSTCYTWNLMTIPGWRSLARKDLESAVLHRIKMDRFGAVQVVARIKHEPRPFGIARWSDPVFQIWEVSRSIPWTLMLGSLLWMWFPLVFYSKFSIKK